MEKGVEKGASKYLARYPFSSRIKCTECGSNFKRRIHTNGDNKYVAWSCSKHLNNIEECSMRFLYEDSIHQAFVVMINKLIYGHKQVLKPLLQSLKTVNYSENIEQIQLLEKEIESNNERSQVLVSLMTKGYLEPALFNEQNNALLQESASLKEKKALLANSINGDISSTSEIEYLLKFVSKQTKQVDTFNEEIFEQFVDSIIVFSQKEIGFKMKCGLTLRERLMN